MAAVQIPLKLIMDSWMRYRSLALLDDSRPCDPAWLDFRHNWQLMSSGSAGPLVPTACSYHNVGFSLMYCIHMQVRIWNVERSQEQILDNMRVKDGVADQSGLVAYWTFDDPNM